MNVGLLYTPVSIYQMTRGALVLFVGVFSVLFLRRRLWLYQSVFITRFLNLYSPVLPQMDFPYRRYDRCCSRWLQRVFSQGCYQGELIWH
jgi:hypothetical protein